MTVQLVLLATALLMAWPAAGQNVCGGDCPLPPSPVPGFLDSPEQFRILGVNAALGGLTGGLRQWRNEGSFRDGFLRGALGGAGVFAGKWIAASEMPGAGMVGRTTAAVGASITRNASEGQPTLHRLILPVGPVRLHWFPTEGSTYFSVDALAVGSVLATILSPTMDLDFDSGRSLTSGTPVFLARNWQPRWGWHGLHRPGAIVLRGDREGPPWVDDRGRDPFLDRALAHERVHMIQYDQAYILWGDPAETWIMRRLGAGPGLTRHVDFSLHAFPFFLVDRVMDYDDLPWEIEAHTLSGTRDTYGR
jgi:hypothetical protein